VQVTADGKDTLSFILAFRSSFKGGFHERVIGISDETARRLVPPERLPSCRPVYAGGGSVTAPCTTRRRTWARITSTNSSRASRGQYDDDVRGHELSDVLGQ
jgi:hypothetical protein